MLAIFFMCQWYAARLFSILKLPTIPVEIGVGLLFGPHGLDLIPAFSHDYSPLQLLGFIGVGLVIFESGMHMDTSKVANWDIGSNVVITAVLGTAMPICLGMLFMYALGSDVYPGGLAAGFSLAPTSVGISLTMLSRAKQLNTRCGQIIMSAAFLDDIFSIICLVVMVNLAGGDLDIVMHVIVPLICAFGFVILAGILSVFLPDMSVALLDTTYLQCLGVDTRSMTLKDELHMFYMIGLYLLLSWVGHVIGSALLGAFAAGMLFSQVPRSHLVWDRQFKRIVRWLIRLFFSCTVAFSINISDLFTAEAFWKGLVLASVPCLGAKLVCGAFVGAERWVIGVAMMARGEFAYLVAEEAHSLEMLEDNEYAVVVWALLWATLIAPMAFGKTLKAYTFFQFEKEGQQRSSMIGGNALSGESSFVIRYFGLHHVGLVREVCESLHKAGFDVKKCITEKSGRYGMGTFMVYPREALLYSTDDEVAPGSLSLSHRKMMKYQMCTDLTDEKLTEIMHTLKECINDDTAQISFEPMDKGALRVAEIQIVGDDHTQFLNDIAFKIIQEWGYNIIRTVIDDHTEGVVKTGSKEGYSVLYCTKKHLQGEDGPISIVPTSSDSENTDVTVQAPRGNSVAKAIARETSNYFDFKLPEVSEEDAKQLKVQILSFIRSQDSNSKCDVLIQRIHEDAVILPPEKIQKADAPGEGISASRTTSFKEMDLQNSGISIPSRLSASKIDIGNNITIPTRLSASRIDLGNNITMPTRLSASKIDISGLQMGQLSLPHIALKEEDEDAERDEEHQGNGSYGNVTQKNESISLV